MKKNVNFTDYIGPKIQNCIIQETQKKTCQILICQFCEKSPPPPVPKVTSVDGMHSLQQKTITYFSTELIEVDSKNFNKELQPVTLFKLVKIIKNE